MTTIEKIFFYFIISQPILDIMTSMMTIAQMPLTIGAIIRFTVMLILLGYMLITFIQNKQYGYFVLLVSPFLLMGLTLIINFLIKQPFFLFEEVKFILKTSYFVTLSSFAVFLIKKRVQIYKISFRAIPIVSIIIASSFWVALITNTHVASYTYEKTGYAGWFFSANELSCVVLILLGLTIVYLHKSNNRDKIIQFIALSFLISMLPMIGTKTAFGGGLILLGTYSFYLLFLPKKQLVTKRFKLVFLTIVCLFFIAIPLAPIATNTESLTNETNNEPLELVTNKQMIHPVLNKILSSRDIYLQMTAKDFYNSSFIRQLFGIGYGGNYEIAPKVVEMDFFDLFFSYGYLGFVVLIIPLIMLIRYSVIKKLSMTAFLLQLTISLLLVISFLAGHVLFAPSVMTYFIVLLLQTAESHDMKLGES